MLIALRQWGQDWGHGKTDILLADKRDGIPVKRIRVQASDGRDLKLSELMWIDGHSGRPIKRDDSE